MKEFTVSEFRSDCKKVWQAVGDSGVAVIKHRDRDSMAVIPLGEYVKLKNAKAVLDRKNKLENLGK